MRSVNSKYIYGRVVSGLPEVRVFFALVAPAVVALYARQIC